MKRIFQLTIAASAALLFSAQAQPTSAAFDYFSVDTVLNRTDVEQARADLARSRVGLSASLDIEPFVTFGGAVGETAEFDLGLNSDLGVDYRYDVAAILADEIDLLRAQARLAESQRRDIETALLTHADLLRAMIAVTIEQQDLSNEQEDFDEVQTEFDDGDATEAQLEDARIELDDARLSLERAERNLANTRSDAVRLGVGPNPSFEILRFELPDAAPERTFEYMVLALQLRRADALGLQNTAFGVLEDVRVAASYGTDDANIGLNANLNRGRPGAGVDLSYDLPATDTTASWEIELSLSLHLDDGTPRDFVDAEQALFEAQLDLEIFLNEFSSDAIRERQDAEYAWENLMLAQRQLETDRARLAEVRAAAESLPGTIAALRRDLDTIRADRDAASGDERSALDDRVRSAESALRDAERELRESTNDIASLERALPRSEDALYRQWQTYVRDVENYLSVVDGSWAVAE